MTPRRRPRPRNVLCDWQVSVAAREQIERHRALRDAMWEDANPGAIPPVLDGPDADECNRHIARANDRYES